MIDPPFGQSIWPIQTSNATSGKVFLVGAGPGDPGLITLRGVECLRLADVVLYDYLVNYEVLDHAPAAAEKVRLGPPSPRIRPERNQRPNGRGCTAGGKVVVRLKGGDPFVFGRAAEELAALVAAGRPLRDRAGRDGGHRRGPAMPSIPITSGQKASRSRVCHRPRADGQVGRRDRLRRARRFPRNARLLHGHAQRRALERGNALAGQVAANAGRDRAACDANRPRSGALHAGRCRGHHRNQKASAAGGDCRRRGGRADAGRVLVRGAAVVWAKRCS